MCDYSLQCIKTRLASEGEELFVHRFYTGSKGLASVEDQKALEKIQPAFSGTGAWDKFRYWLDGKMKDLVKDVNKELPAVCIPPGARLQLNGIPTRMQTLYGVGENEDVIFAQLSLEPYRYRDAIRFRNGREVLLQYLNEGLQVRVVSLTPVEEEHQTTCAEEDSYREELCVVFSSTENRMSARQGHLKAQPLQDSDDF